VTPESRYGSIIRALLIATLLFVAVLVSGAVASAEDDSGEAEEGSVAEAGESAADESTSYAVTLVVNNISFEDLVTFEDDLAENVPGILDVARRKYASNVAQLEVECEVTPQELADSLVLIPFTELAFEVVEFSESRIVLTIVESEGGAQALGGAPEASGPEGLPEVSDGRIRVAVLPFDDPFCTGLSSRAMMDLSRRLQGLSFINYRPIGELSRIEWVYGNLPGVNAANVGGQQGIDADWIVVGSITNVDFDYSCTPPVFDRETGRKIVNESWSKQGRLDAAVRIIDLRTREIIYDRSLGDCTSDWEQFRCALESNASMIQDNWDGILNWIYVDLLSFMYTSFDTPCYVAAKAEDRRDRAITPLSARDGLYVGMPMRLYVPGDAAGSIDGSTGGGWTELCKVTVKEVYDTYALIELGDKWYEYFELGEGNNLLWPVPADRW